MPYKFTISFLFLFLFFRNVSVGIKWRVPTLKIDVLLNLSPLFTIVSRNEILFSRIFAVNFIVAW